MGLKGGKAINDDTDLAGCGLAELASKNKKLMMMGSTAGKEGCHRHSRGQPRHRVGTFSQR
jgi:hypothetical protein